MKKGAPFSGRLFSYMRMRHAIQVYGLRAPAHARRTARTSNSANIKPYLRSLLMSRLEILFGSQCEPNSPINRLTGIGKQAQDISNA
ncbi:hypothetical protein D3C81_2032590 [compost metagenome]